MTNDKVAKVLADLERERDALEAEIETMIGDMAAAPEEQRRAGDWAENGPATKRYLELTERLGEIEQTMIDLTRDVASEKPPTVH